MSIDVTDWESAQSALSEEQYKKIDRRREAYLEDPADSYIWEQVKDGLKRA